MVMITSGQLTNEIKQFAKEENNGMKLCVCPKNMRENRLTTFLESHGFLSVPTEYVSFHSSLFIIVVRLFK